MEQISGALGRTAWCFRLALCVSLCSSFAFAQEKKAKEPKPEPFIGDAAKTVNDRSVQFASGKLDYTVTTGMTKLVNEKGEQTAEIFSISYIAKHSKGDRPLTFVFNGGPGSSSVWLHMGAVGPVRVKMGKEGEQPAPPYGYTQNPYSWLEFTDLVFIDPVGTGYSRPKDDESAKRYWNAEGDVESIGEFIRLYLTHEKRWKSPLFVAGESYGTYRAVGLAYDLWKEGIAFNGVILISAFLGSQDSNWRASAIPSYTATAWHHKKLAPDLQSRPLRDLLDEVEAWVFDTYIPAMAMGTRLSEEDKTKLIKEYSRYTGLPEQLVKQADMAVNSSTFFKEILRDEGRTVGRFDSRYIGNDQNKLESRTDYDPSFAAVGAPFTTAINQYFTNDLGLSLDREYVILGGVRWAHKDRPDHSVSLRQVMTQNPYLQILVCSGYYDFATPYFNMYNNIHHMALEPEILDNIHYAEYESGHMMYLREECLEQFYRDVRKFVLTSKG